MGQQTLILLGLMILMGACKKEDTTPLRTTLLSLQVIYQQTGLPVDSAEVIVTGTKGTYLSGREIKTFQQGYTDRQGRFQASMLIPRDYFTIYVTGKVVKIGNHYQSYSVAFSQPSSDILKLGQENIIVAQLDTLK